MTTTIEAPETIEMELPSTLTWGDLDKGDVIVHRYANGATKTIRVIAPAGAPDERGIAKMQVRAGETGWPYILNVHLDAEVGDPGAAETKVYRTYARLRDGITWDEVGRGDVIRTTYPNGLGVEWVVLSGMRDPDPTTQLGLIVIAASGMPFNYYARPEEPIAEGNEGATTVYRPLDLIPTATV